MTEKKNDNINNEETAESVIKEDEVEVVETPEETDGGNDRKKKKEIRRLENELEKASKEKESLNNELSQYKDKYMRMLAEYENYRKRTAKERDGIYADAYGEAIKEILPVLDNLERASQYSDAESVQKGIQMTLKSLLDMFRKLDIKEVETEKFDPLFHCAVMHIEDETKGENEIVEVLQKGYIKGDKVIRYAMVKVAN